MCARCKHQPIAPAGLLEPLPIPSQAWQYISMDFIEQLPKSKGKDTILVVVFCLTEYGHFIPLSHPFTAATVAKTLLDTVFKLQGAPITIVSDRDKLFTSLFWKELFRNLGTSLAYPSAYHPQSDGQTERLNQCLENYLRCMTHHQPVDWCKWLPLAEWWYNTFYHSSLKMSLFEASYGYIPTFVPLFTDEDTAVQAVAYVSQTRQHMLSLIRIICSMLKLESSSKQIKRGVRGLFRWEIGSILSSSLIDRLPLP